MTEEQARKRVADAERKILEICEDYRVNISCDDGIPVISCMYTDGEPPALKHHKKNIDALPF